MPLENMCAGAHGCVKRVNSAMDARGGNVTFSINGT